jgi:flagellar L-ring protein precursor FlgH
MTRDHATTQPRGSLLALAAAALGLILGGCNAASRLSDVGQAPTITPISNPVKAQEYQQVSMPMPSLEMAMPQPASLWRPGSRAFFRDMRATRVGDILTVVIKIDDEAQIENATSRSRDNDDDLSMDAFLGIESEFDDFLPEAVNPSAMLDITSGTSNDGEGTIERDEEISLRVAAVITQMLPNGNLVVQGRQETRVNFELRELWVTGIIRPEDISAGNTILYDQMAEARLIYGGRGQITDVQQPRYGAQVLDIVMPF